MTKYFNTATIVSVLAALLIFTLVIWVIMKNSNWMATPTAVDSSGAPVDPATK